MNQCQTGESVSGHTGKAESKGVKHCHTWKVRIYRTLPISAELHILQDTSPNGLRSRPTIAARQLPGKLATTWWKQPFSAISLTWENREKGERGCKNQERNQRGYSDRAEIIPKYRCIINMAALHCRSLCVITCQHFLYYVRVSLQSHTFNG